MNLVQINERLKDMPVQALQQYANGSNPEVPPFLALGELQRREKLKQQMANAQGAAQGQQPSVKEQIEQKAGLLGLQQAQMQQQQQQMMRPRPGPVPAGTPQPEAQPEVEEMASGGLARMPIRSDMYRFAGGGIIAFQEGGRTMGPSQYDNMSPGTIEDLKANREEYIRAYGQEQYEKILANAERALAVQRNQMAQQLRPEPAPAPALQTQGLKQLTSMQRSPLMQAAVSSAMEVPEKPTAQGVISGIEALQPEQLREAAIARRREEAAQRAAQEQKAFEASRPTGIDQLIKVFGQAGQYKGLSGLGPAYTQNRERMVAEEAAFRRQQEAARAKAEEQELGMAKDLFGARSKEFSSQNEAYQKRLASRTEALASLAGTDQRAIDAALGRMTDAELTKLRIAAERANALRPGEGERVTAQILKLRSEGKADEADAMLQTYTQVKMGGAGGAGMENARTKARRQRMSELATIIEDKGMIHSDVDKKWAAQQYAKLAREIEKDEGDGGLSMTMEDVRTTAKASGKSEADVIAAAKARGYTIK